MGTKKQLEPVDEAVAEILAETVQDEGVSYRAMREETGISINRIGIILRKEPPPATVGEIGAIAGQVGMSASQVIGEAERRLGRGGVGLSSAPDAPDVPDLSDLPDMMAASERDIDSEVQAWEEQP